MAFRPACQVIEEADLKFDAETERGVGVHACFVRASGLSEFRPPR